MPLASDKACVVASDSDLLSLAARKLGPLAGLEEGLVVEAAESELVARGGGETEELPRAT